jgi:hypothetical protein
MGTMDQDSDSGHRRRDITYGVAFVVGEKRRESKRPRTICLHRRVRERERERKREIERERERERKKERSKVPMCVVTRGAKCQARMELACLIIGVGRFFHWLLPQAPF